MMQPSTRDSCKAHGASAESGRDRDSSATAPITFSLHQGLLHLDREIRGLCVVARQTASRGRPVVSRARTSVLDSIG